MQSSSTDLSRRAGGIMTVGARLRTQAASSLPRRGPLFRARGRTERDEEAAAILEHLESGAEEEESAGRARLPGTRGARKVHLAVLPERYEPLEEPAPGDKPKKKYRQKLKKYGKVGVPGVHRPGGRKRAAPRRVRSGPRGLTASAPHAHPRMTRAGREKLSGEERSKRHGRCPRSPLTNLPEGCVPAVLVSGRGSHQPLCGW